MSAQDHSITSEERRSRETGMKSVAMRPRSVLGILEEFA